MALLVGQFETNDRLRLTRGHGDTGTRGILHSKYLRVTASPATPASIYTHQFMALLMRGHDFSRGLTRGQRDAVTRFVNLSEFSVSPRHRVWSVSHPPHSMIQQRRADPLYIGVTAR